MSVKDQDMAEREVRAFLDVYGLQQTVPDWLLPRSRASSISTLLMAARIAKTEERRKLHEDNAASKLAQLIDDANHDPVAFYACGELFDQLIKDGTPIPDELSRLAASVFRGKQPPPKGRPGPKKYANLGRDAIIHECILIAAKHVKPIYDEDGRGVTAVEVVSWCLASYGIDQNDLDVPGITGIWKKYNYERKTRITKGTN